MQGQDVRYRFMRHVVVPAVVVVIVVAAVIAAILGSSTRQADQMATARQQRLMQLVITQTVKAIGHEQEASTVWDEAILQLRKTPRDLDWIDNNLGVWLGTYYGHDKIFILAPDGSPVYAMEGNQRRPEATYRVHAGTLQPLVTALRTKMRNPGPDDQTDQVLSPGVAVITIVDGHPAIASAKPVVSDTGEMEQTAGEEFVHLAVRYLDTNFLHRLSTQYQFENVRFSWRSDPRDGEVARALIGQDGRGIGYIIWTPFAPGSGVIANLAPALAGALLLVGIIMAALMIRVWRSTMQLIASRAQAEHLAFHDSLTGLANRAKFEDQLKHELARVKRGAQSIALLYLDMDRFKHVNDSLGHPAGDELIRALASRLRDRVREVDTVARLGGDEFAIIQTGVATPAETEILCMRLIEAVNEPFEVGGSLLNISISIGVAAAPDHSIDDVELTRMADIALYQAKADGRGRYVRFTVAMDASVQHRKTVEADLRAALQAGDQLSVSYQPLFSAHGTEMVGVEALARWMHPERGMVPPSTFIPIAEESGLIDDLGRWVLREACACAATHDIPSVAVNVSPAQLRNPHFASDVLDILHEVGLPPARLELEITETCLIEAAEQYLPNITRLRAAGVRIALDDFGTGYSSLSHLRQFDVDRVKIDRSFVSSIAQDSGSAIIQAIVDLARASGLRVTAEGVETPEQQHFLEAVGCDELQGYLLGRPMSLVELDRLRKARTA